MYVSRLFISCWAKAEQPVKPYIENERSPLDFSLSLEVYYYSGELKSLFLYDNITIINVAMLQYWLSCRCYECCHITPNIEMA